MKYFFTLYIICFSFCLSSGVTRPNVIYILADDLGLGDVMAYNANGKIPTPNIDRIANEGVLFTDAHSNSSVCTPTRYGILTGRYAWRTHLKSRVLQGHSPHLIDPARETVASFLKKRGYATACIGKWHLGMDWASSDGGKVNSNKPRNVDLRAPIRNGPLDLGFDYYFGISASLNMDPHAYIENRQIQGTMEYLEDLDAVNARGFTQPTKPGWAAREYKQEEVLAVLADKATSWMKENAEHPFFVYLPLPSPHSPIVPSEKFKGKSGLNGHGDFTMETDWFVGEVLQMLDKLGIVENTLVIFTADNGTSPNANFKYLQSQGHFPSLNYRGLKGTLWEGGHRVPFVVRWPNSVQSGSRSNQTICTTDLLATCANLFEINLPDNVGEDSVSFLPAMMGKKIPDNDSRVIVHHSDSGEFAVRRGRWKLMFDNEGGSNRRNPKDKPVINDSELLLFDMEADPEESTNLAGAHPHIVTKLKKSLASIIQRGRSNSGANQPSDHLDPSVEWPQIDQIRAFFSE